MIKGEGTLTLNGSYQQPCIGCATSTGLSYGRWQPSRDGHLRRLVIDGVTVICNSLVTNFSIGKYNENSMPEIKVVNGGKLIAPEMNGKRVQTVTAYAPNGSTKISSDPTYVIIEEGKSESDYIPDEIKQILKRLPDNISSCAKLDTNRNAIKKAVTLYEFGKKYITDNELISLLGVHNSDNVDYSYGAILLSMPSIDYTSEMFYEMDKWDYLKNFVTEELDKNSDPTKYIASMMKYLQEELESSEFRNELLYEMIPAYLYDWGHENDKYNHIGKFIDKCYKQETDQYIDFNKLLSVYR